VTAIEVDADLATRARENLERWPNVDMRTGDGGEFDPGPVDAIFVNAGVTHPRALWLDRLRDGGRLLLPLTFDVGGGTGKGVMMLVRREGDRARCGIEWDAHEANQLAQAVFGAIAAQGDA
jgi:protein-L-isoaspartate(D-aspartate) O-methyltransferase